MRILITGGRGQLGTELALQLAAGGSALGPIPAALQSAEVVQADLPELDVADRAALLDTVHKLQPDIILHCAAFTNVDGCESEPDTAFCANAVGARNVALAAEAVGAKLVHLSTDYVFSGEGTVPFTEAHPTGPRSVYGETKLLGESYVRQFCSRAFVVRTAWLYGVAGSNFVKTILRVVREKGEAMVVNDQLGTPTNAEDLAHHLLQLAVGEEYGLYHCTGQGVCSWYEFAAEAVRLAGMEATVSPCTTDEFPRAARRPAYSALDNAMLRATIGDGMRPWQQALADFLARNPQ